MFEGNFWRQSSEPIFLYLILCTIVNLMNVFAKMVFIEVFIVFLCTENEEILLSANHSFSWFHFLTSFPLIVFRGITFYSKTNLVLFWVSYQASSCAQRAVRLDDKVKTCTVSVSLSLTLSVTSFLSLSVSLSFSLPTHSMRLSLCPSSCSMAPSSAHSILHHTLIQNSDMIELFTVVLFYLNKCYLMQF